MVEATEEQSREVLETQLLSEVHINGARITKNVDDSPMKVTRKIITVLEDLEEGQINSVEALEESQEEGKLEEVSEPSNLLKRGVSL